MLEVLTGVVMSSYDFLLLLLWNQLLNIYIYFAAEILVRMWWALLKRSALSSDACGKCNVQWAMMPYLFLPLNFKIFAE